MRFLTNLILFVVILFGTLSAEIEDQFIKTKWTGNEKYENLMVTIPNDFYFVETCDIYTSEGSIGCEISCKHKDGTSILTSDGVEIHEIKVGLFIENDADTKQSKYQLCITYVAYSYFFNYEKKFEQFYVGNHQIDLTEEPFIVYEDGIENEAYIVLKKIE